ncbi:Sulfur carrier protein ThiS [Planctomycetes bacterium MalM25]|nr:Sulfur carrier protein ThiS [Planctomycetes bacterium MalM25]
MTIQLNGEPRDVPEGCSIAALLELLEVRMKGVAVERNQQVIPRAKHGSTQLSEGDRVEVVTLVGGG